MRRTFFIITKEFFQVFLITYLLLVITETFKPGFVSNFFNLNILLILVLATGTLMVITEPKTLTPLTQHIPKNIPELKRTVVNIPHTVIQIPKKVRSTVKAQITRPKRKTLDGIELDHKPPTK